MTSDTVSNRVSTLRATIAPLLRFIHDSAWAKREDPGYDFTFGNPYEMPLPQYVEALQQAIMPCEPDWFAYKQSEPEAQAIISASLSQRLEHLFEASDICLTNGAIAGRHIILNTIINPGDEVIFMTPHWFLYEGLILNAGGRAVKVRVDAETFDLNLRAIQAAISGRTRAIIINTPHNPTGKLYGHTTLAALGRILAKASAENKRTIYLLSDEAYHQVVFDNQAFISPATIYPHTFLIYTYGKVHLAPGQRLGFIALPHQMPNRLELRQAINLMQTFLGWAFPNALPQYALGDLVQISIDIDQLQARRDRLMASLADIGYRTIKPEGTFYLLVQSPLANDWDFVERLATYNVFCMPGCTFGLPGYFRLTLTATDDMVIGAIPRFAAAFAAVQ